MTWPVSSKSTLKETDKNTTAPRFHLAVLVASAQKRDACGTVASISHPVFNYLEVLSTVLPEEFLRCWVDDFPG